MILRRSLSIGLAVAQRLNHGALAQKIQNLSVRSIDTLIIAAKHVLNITIGSTRSLYARCCAFVYIRIRR